VIAGRPNAGKSSLFNLLLREERSIVTEIPGTTRDWIEAWIAIEGIPIRLADTAGLRDESPDPVEKLGVERSRALLEEAELVIYLIDGAAGVTDEDAHFIQQPPSKPRIVLWNKADIAPPPPSCDAMSPSCDAMSPSCDAMSPSCDAISISAKTGEGMAELTAAIVKAAKMQAEEIAVGEDTQDPALGSARQKKLVEAAAAALEQAIALAEREEPLDLIAPLLREAINSLGEITGEVSAADILEEMFSRFCVGK
jgi:tRNA modification GTPase